MLVSRRICSDTWQYLSYCLTRSQSCLVTRQRSLGSFSKAFSRLRWVFLGDVEPELDDQSFFCGQHVLKLHNLVDVLVELGRNDFVCHGVFHHVGVP